jgi:hypothetical protein
MHRAWLQRLNALILGLLIMGGGSGLPVVDAVLHHLHGQAQVAGIRLSNPADSSLHAERCTLGAPLPTLARSAGIRATDHIAALPGVALSMPEPADPATASLCSPTQARAPPLSLG